MKFLIIGGVAGGATAAGRLRRLNEKAEIIMLERGPYISFANCGLPYFIGGDIATKEELVLETPETFGGRYGIDVRIHSEATKIDPKAKTVTIKNHKTGDIYTESYDSLLISTGAEPIRTSLPGVTLENVFTLRTVPDAAEIRDFVEKKAPKSAAIVGGGFIGLELLDNLARHNLDLTLIERSDHVITGLEADMAGEVHQYIRDKGVNLRLETSFTEITNKGNKLEVHCSPGQSVTVDMVALAIGVAPESSLAKEAGLALGVHDTIAVDKYMRTSDPSIYAIGDAVQVEHFVSGKGVHIPLAGPANKQSRIAANNMSGIEDVYRGSQGSSVLKIFDMTVATTGLTLKEAEQVGFEADSVVVYEIDHAGYYPGASNIALKVVYEKNTGTILGAQSTGFGGVDKRVDILATAIRGRMTAQDLTDLDLCYAPPYATTRDIVNLAGYIIEGSREGRVALSCWKDAPVAQRDTAAIFLDVRGPDEVAKEPLAGFINIPLAELSSRYEELDKSKQIYTTCHSGHRSYVASLLLVSYGYKVSNICGGWRLHQSLQSGKDSK